MKNFERIKKALTTMYEAVVQMYLEKGLEPLVFICSPHNCGNASKRTISENLVRYWP